MVDPAAKAAEPTLTVGETPPAAAAAPASAGGDRTPNKPYLINPTTAGVWDDKGRFIEVRRLGPVDRMDLAVILGPENAKNPMVQGYSTLAFCVAKIDGEVIMPPMKYSELRSMVGRLGDEGLGAVAEAAELVMPEAVDAVDAATVKN